MSKSDEDAKLHKVGLITKIVENEWSIFQQKKWLTQEKGYDYIASRQYSPDEKAYYESQKRPTNVFNVAVEKFNFILGDHFVNDVKQRVFHKAGGSPQTAQAWEDILYHYHSVNDYRMEIGRTVLAGWIGLGALYVRWSDEKDIDGGIVYSNLDEFDVMWDSRARDYFLDDAKYMIRHRWMAVGDIKKEWPEKQRQIADRIEDMEDSDYMYQRSDWEITAASDPKHCDKKNGKYRVIEFHEKVYEDTEIAVEPETGEANIFNLQDKRRRDMFLKANPKIKIITSRADVKKITTVIPALAVHLGERKADVQDGRYDIIIYHPYPYGRTTIDHFGLSKIIEDPQNFLNDMMNRKLDIMNKTANAGSEILEDAYHNSEDAKRFGAAPGLLLRKKMGFQGQKTYERFDPPQSDPSTSEMLQEAKYFMDIISSTTENMVGRQETSNEPASLYAQRVAQGQIKFAVPTYCLNGVKQRLNQKMIALGQSNIPTNKLFLILDKKTGDSKELYVNLQAGDEILNNLNVGEFEVVVEDSNKNPTAMLVRNERKMQIVQLLTGLLGPMAAAAIDWDWLLGDTDLGDMTQLIERIKKVIQGQLDAQAQQGAIAQTQSILETAKTQADAISPEPQMQQTNNSGTSRKVA